ncbi:uncharacterized protein C15orf41 homolog isoform X1 [Lingula anatina]|uniref:CDAN1-interacting nuclease 1 n=1 Tax=Lingula anatina TaxID=7574 RepID=A0A1S3K9J4_LINAN|nr:uncharacterized protein C15orf41 homolog isoform X1 [Lingula anatina]|eukprot:XP_013419300.1 uncharacterized protein C15orf41 homolog isoform X1 [Lingula anatina]
MKLADYQYIVKNIHHSWNRNCLQDLAKKFPEYSMETIGSIYSQEYQKKMKKTHFKHYTQHITEEYYDRYQIAIGQGQEQVLVKMSEEVDLSPILLARIVLERHLAHTVYGGENVPKSVLSQQLKDPSLIEDAVLANEVSLCLLMDDNYGHYVDTIKHSVGHEYELLLKEKVEEKGLAYLGEDQLRIRGYDKTPDTKLEVPIAVDGHVVNWIESKASFGDEDSHKGYLKDQFWSYWNRFGPGLVIYWFGFIDELDTNRDKGILLMDHFPENIVYMNPKIVSRAQSVT